MSFFHQVLEIPWRIETKRGEPDKPLRHNPISAPRPRTRLVRAKKPTPGQQRTGGWMAVVYDPPHYEKWKASGRELVERRVRELGRVPWSTAEPIPIEVMVLAVFELPKSEIRKTKMAERRWQVSSNAGDWDNLGKPICDAAQGVLWPEDCWIARGTVEKIVGAQDEKPRLEILARPLPAVVDTVFERTLAELGIEAAPAGQTALGF